MTALFAVLLPIAGPIVSPIASHAATPAALADLEPGGKAVVDAVIDGDTLRLADGRVVRLAGIAAPKSGPEAAAAAEGLDALVRGRSVSLAYGGRHADRHGRLIAHLCLLEADGMRGGWVEAALLAAGLVRVRTTLDSRALAAPMLAIEATARAARKGLWADPAYRVREPNELADVLGSFQIVEGRVLSAGTGGARLYLNFGPDYASDFTLALDGAAQRRFRKAGIDPASLAGRRIRVRGWVKSFDGPRIDITHPEQIEMLP